MIGMWCPGGFDEGVMNLEKLLELLFVFFAYLLLLLLRNEPDKGSRFAHLSNQVVPA